MDQVCRWGLWVAFHTRRKKGHLMCPRKWRVAPSIGQCLLREDSSTSDWLQLFRRNLARSFGREKRNKYILEVRSIFVHIRKKPTEFPFPSFFRKTRKASQGTLPPEMVKKCQSGKIPMMAKKFLSTQPPEREGPEGRLPRNVRSDQFHTCFP